MRDAGMLVHLFRPYASYMIWNLNLRTHRRTPVDDLAGRGVRCRLLTRRLALSERIDPGRWANPPLRQRAREEVAHWMSYGIRGGGAAR